MMKTQGLFIFLSVTLVLAQQANADANVSWETPENFTDIKVAEGSQSKFQDSIMKRLSKHLEKLSVELSDGQKLWVKILDIDLAGEVLPGFNYGIQTGGYARVVKRIYFPEIQLSFNLMDSNGKVMQKGQVVLKDLSFQDGIHSRNKSRDSLYYEKKLLSDWFKETFPQQVARK